MGRLYWAKSLFHIIVTFCKDFHLFEKLIRALATFWKEQLLLTLLTALFSYASNSSSNLERQKVEVQK